MSKSVFPDWVANAVFYQIFPDRFSNGDRGNDPPEVASWTDAPTRENFFGGDLQGIVDRLDYLQDLGVNAIYLTPIFKARTNHKYDAEDYFQVDPAFGTNELLKRLVQEMHRRQMRLILDGVFNHCGQEFPGFQDLKVQGEQSAYRDWFLVKSYPVQAEPLSYMTCGGCTYLPKFNHAYRPVRDYLLRVGRYWLEEYEIDGWRLDVPFKVSLDFWQEFRYMVKTINPDAYLVGEVWRDAGPWVQGDVFDGTTNYRLRELLFDYCLTQVLDAEDFSYETDTLRQHLGNAAQGMLNLLGSHDTARVLTHFKGDVDRLKVALTFLFTTQGAPLVYYGDEVGMVGENDPDCRRAMRWDLVSDKNPIFQLINRLTKLRIQHPATRQGTPERLFTFNGAYVYKQSHENDELIVVLNPRDGIPNVRVKTSSDIPLWRDVFSQMLVDNSSGVIEFKEIPAVSTMILIPHPY